MEKVKHFLLQTMPKILSLLLVVLIFLSSMDVHFLRGTAKIIDLTGGVRGMSQQLVKQEILGLPNDSQIASIEQLITELRNGGSTYVAIPLQNVEYQSSLAVLNRYWFTLKDEIMALRTGGAEGTDILYVSEHFYTLADQSVTKAVAYSDQITRDLQVINYAMVLCSLLMVGLMLFSSIQNRKLSNANSVLSYTAYLDKHTGLPNKSKCEELLNAPEELDLSTACVMFDLNNLKKINDAMGHQAGDDMIKGFAQLLRKATPPADFVGRYGGDEFIVILKEITPGGCDAFLEKLGRMTADYNRSGTQFMPVIPLSYAAGYAHSAQVPNSTMADLLKVADTHMYADKARIKAALRKEDQVNFR